MSASDPRSKVNFLALCADAPGSGKDTLFNLLAADNPLLDNIKFSDALTDEVANLFSFQMDREDFLEVRHNPATKDYKLASFKPANIWGSYGSDYMRFLLESGWDLDERMSARDHLNVYGTQYIRDFKKQDNYWLDRGLKAVEDSLAKGRIPVITDVRFPNEAKRVQEAGGTLIRVAADFALGALADRTVAIAEGHLEGWRFDADIKNVFNQPDNMKAQFNARFKF